VSTQTAPGVPQFLDDRQDFAPGRERPVELALVPVYGPDELDLFERQFALFNPFLEGLLIFITPQRSMPLRRLSASRRSGPP
jgi:hypothetical protein